MDEHVMGTYLRQTPVFVRGHGAVLVDEQGREFLDLLSGLGVCALGHSHPRWVEAVCDQATRLTHVSNLLRHPHTEKVAGRLCALTNMAEVFFCNSGTEAVECALKLARKAQVAAGHPGRTSFVALEGGFHGRTLGSLSITSNEAYRAPFGPALAAHFIEPTDVHALQRALDEQQPAALVVEPVQGEGGLHELSGHFLAMARKLCDETGTFLISDEVQCGLGRTGTFLAIQATGVQPDLATLAKPLAGGLPIGATLVSERLAGTLVPGDHGSTFGGGPLVLRAALAVLDELQHGGLLDAVPVRGSQLREGLERIVERHEMAQACRGRGLMQGLVLPGHAGAVQSTLFERGYLTGTAAGEVLRFLPPYVISEEQLADALAALDGVLTETQETLAPCNP